MAALRRWRCSGSFWAPGSMCMHSLTPFSRVAIWSYACCVPFTAIDHTVVIQIDVIKVQVSVSSAEVEGRILRGVNHAVGISSWLF